jgi:hypothetical protein
MKFGIFYEHQIPRPWDADAEHRIYREALEQVELADRVGIDYAWEVGVFESALIPDLEVSSTRTMTFAGSILSGSDCSTSNGLS